MWRLLILMVMFPVLLSLAYFIYHGDTVMTLTYLGLIPFYLYALSMLKL